MLLSPFAATLARLADKALQLITGCPPAPPSFDNLLEELFESWPLDAEEELRRPASRLDLAAA
jgi:hypothetical protein